MTKKEFAQWAGNQNIFLDGATGSNLIQRGMPAGVCPEQWILEHREILISLQREYVEAGSNILYAPTFSGNRIKLAEYGLEGELEKILPALVALSKEAADGKAYVAGDITMTGEQLRPMGKMEFETLVRIYKEQIQIMEEAGVDLLVVETMMSLQEARAALIAAKEVSSLPVLVTMTFEGDGRTLYGTDAVTAAVVLQSLGADGVGVNCSAGPDKMLPVVKAMAEILTVPLIAKPNAGLPAAGADGSTYYDMDKETFVEYMKQLQESGVSILGGCCGTTPEYIRLLKEEIGEKRVPATASDSKTETPRYLTSERQTVSFGLNGSFLVVGERINPTGKKKLQEALRNGSMELVKTFAEEQELAGAGILDVNMGMSGIDEKAVMLQAMEEISTVTNLPLSLDSSHVEVLEAALRNYPGRALVNSVSFETEKFEKLLPIVAKYGAMFILLPLSDKGLPESLEEKIDIIHKIYEKALSLGMHKEDIVVDGLVTTVGANKNAALETLETIAYCKKLGLATICGLSNISFGMPERGFVNTAFLTMAIQSGLTMAIANPSQELLMCCAFASDLLLNKKNADIRYIEYANLIKEKREMTERVNGPVKSISFSQAVKKQENTTEATDSKEQLKQAVLKGNQGTIQAVTRQALQEGISAQELLNQVLLPAINLVGDYFEQGKYFLPQLIASAQAMKLSIEILEPLLAQDNRGEEMPVIVIATVKGDIHDIGKNLVALMLKNYGFQVIDLGKDVPKEVIVEKAKEVNASIIALSALMTTTMRQMKEVIEYAKEQGVTAKVMIGGAVITQEYADEIGASGYSKDAADAVKLAKRLLGLMTVEEEVK